MRIINAKKRKALLAALISGTMLCGWATYLPSNAYARGTGSTEVAEGTLGSSGTATASGNNSVSVGSGSEASGNNSTALGQAAQATGTKSTAVGMGATAVKDNSIALGYYAGASGGTGDAYAVAIGSNAQSYGTGTIAIGGGDGTTGTSKTLATADYAVSMGYNATAAGEGSIALGKNSYSIVTATNGVAIGNGAEIGNSNSVALGANSSTSAAHVDVTAQKYTYTLNGNNVTLDYAGIASDTNGTVSVGKSTATRQIQNVAAGNITISSTDAVNGSQLYQTNQAVQAVSNYVGTVTTGNYVSNANSVGANINVLDTQLKSAYDAFNAATGADLDGIISYDSTDKSKVTLKGTSGTTLANVKSGELSATSKEAVNGSQLYTTNQQVAANSSDITNIKSDISNLNDDIGRVGALSAAMAGLHPRFQSGNKGEVAMALGGYGGQKAMAIGGFYAPNEQVMFSVGGGFSEGGSKMYNVGVNFVLDRVQSRKNISTEAMYTKSEVDNMLSTQDKQIKLLMNKLATLEAKVK